jgi:predicted Fe-Mo cluster-binding NifX family protein
VEQARPDYNLKREELQVKIVVTSDGVDLDAQASPVFGRCQTYVFVDTETMGFEAVPNPALVTASGAGIQAAQFVVEQGAQAVLTGNVGPNAFGVFQAGNVPIFLVPPGTVRQAVEAYKSGRLQPLSDPNVAAHAGVGMGRGRGRGMGMGRGRGMGRGMGMGQAVPGAAPPAGPARAEEVEALKQAASELRQQLAEIMERIDKLEKGE